MEEKFLESDGRAENSLRNYFFHLHHHHAPMNKNQQINFSIQFLILMLAGWAWWKRNVQLMAKQKIAFFFHCLLIPIPNLLHAAFGEYLFDEWKMMDNFIDRSWNLCCRWEKLVCTSVWSLLEKFTTTSIPQWHWHIFLRSFFALVTLPNGKKLKGEWRRQKSIDQLTRNVWMASPILSFPFFLSLSVWIEDDFSFVM